MPLNLDARQIAMLAEMGVRVFSPPALVTAATPASPAPDWHVLEQDLATCQRCGLCAPARSAMGHGDRSADWLVVGDFPSPSGTPYDGDEMALLTNMLRAVSVSTAKGAYVTSLMRCRKPDRRNPTRAEVEACMTHLAHEVAAVKPKVVLVVGALAAAAILGSQSPLGRLRGSVRTGFNTPLVVTYSPGYLLRNPEHKARAWADLCLALTVIRGAPAQRGAEHRPTRGAKKSL